MMTREQVEEAATALETLAAEFRALNTPKRGKTIPFPHATGFAVHPARVAVDLIAQQQQDEWADLIVRAENSRWEVRA